MYFNPKCCIADPSSSSGSSSNGSGNSGDNVANDCSTTNCTDGVMPRRYRFEWPWDAEIHPAELYPDPFEAPFTYGSVCTSKYIVGGWTLLHTTGCAWESSERYGLQDASFGPGPSSPPGFQCLDGPGPLAWMTITSPYAAPIRRISVFMACQSGLASGFPPTQPLLAIEYRAEIYLDPGEKLDCLGGFTLPIYTGEFLSTVFIRGGIYHDNSYSPDPPNSAPGDPFPYPPIPELITVVAA